ncbi:MAG: phytase [Pseudomonadota bacterium]
MPNRLSILCLALAAAGLAGCGVSKVKIPLEAAKRGDVIPRAETQPVPSDDDAADDPAIWVNLKNRGASRIIGTDKQNGLYVYALNGVQVQSLPMGRINNVDLRQWLTVGGWTGDLVAASNRSRETVELLQVEEDGRLKELGPFAVGESLPYGVCMGRFRTAVLVFVTHETGAVRMFRIAEIGPAGANVQFLGRLKFKTKTEGCVFDDQAEALYVGEESRGIWKIGFTNGGVIEPKLIARTGENGLRADVEGLAIYRTRQGGYLIASSQGNNAFNVYDRYEPHKALAQFRIVDNVAFGVDGAQDTDGVEATSIALGEDYPKGMLVVQDGRNSPAGNYQNFKIVDWRDVDAALFPSSTSTADRLATGVGDPNVIDGEVIPFIDGAVLEGGR